MKLNSFVQGTGLGLAISKSIVEQMGGRIGLNSEPGKGSCFGLRILTSGPGLCRRLLPMRRCGNQAFRRKMPVVLVAEDTDSNFLLVSLILKKGYEVLRAHNGAEAVRMCREFAPDVVLMDMKMPVMDGLKLRGRFGRREVPFPSLPSQHMHTTATVRKRSMSGAMIILPNH